MVRIMHFVLIKSSNLELNSILVEYRSILIEIYTMCITHIVGQCPMDIVFVVVVACLLIAIRH